jgi:hypothetical protein
VLFPFVQPRIKESDERTAFRVKCAEVRSFMCIAVVTGESEIFVVVTSAVLASDDVFDVIDEEWLCVLRKAAVLAAMIGTFTDGFAGAARPLGSMAFGQ